MQSLSFFVRDLENSLQHAAIQLRHGQRASPLLSLEVRLRAYSYKPGFLGRLWQRLRFALAGARGPAPKNNSDDVRQPRRVICGEPGPLDRMLDRTCPHTVLIRVRAEAGKPEQPPSVVFLDGREYAPEPSSGR